MASAIAWPVNASAAPLLRVRPAPRLDPPFDDECELPPPGMQMLPLPWPAFPRNAAPTRRGADGAGRGPDGDPEGGRDDGRDNGPAGPRILTARHDLARAVEPAGTATGHPARDGRLAAQRFVRLYVEIVNGFRPVAHLRPVIEPQQFAAVAGQVFRPGASTHPSRPHRTGVRLTGVRRIRTCEPVDGVVEAAAVLGRGDTCWALAVRLERHAAGWRCALVRVV